MTLPGAIAVVVLLEGLAAATLLSAVARVRIAADQRAAIEAELAVTTALALTRVSQGAALAGIPPGGGPVVFPPPTVAGWEVVMTASREGGDAPIRLVARVMRRNPDGAPHAAGSGTLLLVAISADTARVLIQREQL